MNDKERYEAAKAANNLARIEKRAANDRLRKAQLVPPGETPNKSGRSSSRKNRRAYGQTKSRKAGAKRRFGEKAAREHYGRKLDDSGATGGFTVELAE